MEAIIISLRDEYFAKTCSDFFQTLSSTRSFADVTLVSNDSQKVLAHSFVLSSCSPVFKSIIQNHIEANKELIISFADFSFPVIRTFAELIYQGEATTSMTDKSDVWALMENFQIENHGFGTEIKEDIDDEATMEKELVQNENLDKLDVNCYKSDPMEIRRNSSINEPRLDRCEDKDRKRKNNQKVNVLNNHNRHFPCEECTYIANRMQALKRHVLNMHGVGKKFSCKECGYLTTGKDDLREHIKDTHYSVNYPCQKCQFQTTTLKLFNAHVRKEHLQK